MYRNGRIIRGTGSLMKIWFIESEQERVDMGSTTASHSRALIFNTRVWLISKRAGGTKQVKQAGFP